MLPRRDLEFSLYAERRVNLRVRLLHVVHGLPLRATLMPRRQYSRLDAARATVMSRWRDYVIGPRGALPILPVQQLLLLLLRLPEVMLSPGVSI